MGAVESLAAPKRLGGEESESEGESESGIHNGAYFTELRDGGGGWVSRRRAGHYPIIHGHDIDDDRDQHQHDRDDEAPVLMEFFLGVFRLVVVAHKNEDCFVCRAAAPPRPMIF